MADTNLRVGLYGMNGHQIPGIFPGHPRARLTAVAHFPGESVEELRRRGVEPAVESSLDDLIARDDVDLVSLCSPRRADQGGHAVACLDAGKHVYAEKPCAVSDEELDCILAVAERSGRQFHEMAGTAFEQPYWAMRSLAAEGVLGDVVQVLVQKSYPYHDRRPQDEAVDGGLICQNGVHAARFVEHTAGVKIAGIDAVETTFGDPQRGGGLRMAASYMGRLENGGLVSMVANYLNPPGFGSWGNEMLRIFGTKGMLESCDAGKRTRLVVGAEDRGEIDTSVKPPDWFDAIVDSILDGSPMPLSLEDELHPTRVVIRANLAAKTRGLC